MIRRTHSTAEQVPILGETVGPYRILGALGDGRLGHLYVAEQSEARDLPKVVALRHLRSELCGSARFMARFQEAVRVATRYEHPNLLSVFELGQTDGRCFLGMEYLPGENVEAILRRCSSGEAMPADIAAYVVKQAAAVHQCLGNIREVSPHGVHVPHDEVGPSNLFVSHHGTVKWLAWGLRAIADEVGATAEVVSRPANAPRPTGSDRALARPEGNVETRRRADVSSLGRLLWTCLVGQGRSASEAALGDRLPAGVPETLGSVVRRALAVDPRESFESPGELADELERYLLQRQSRPTPRDLRRWLEQLFGAERALLQMRVVRGRDVQAALAHLGAALPIGGPAKSVRSFSSPRPRELWLTRRASFSQFGRASIAPPRSFDRVPGSVPDGFSGVSLVSIPRPSVGVEPPPSTLGSAELPAWSQARERPSRAAWAVATLAACSVLALAALTLVPARHDEPRVGAPAQGAAPPVSSGVSVRSKPEGAAVFIDGEPTGLSTPVVIRGLAAGRSIRMRVEKAGFQSREQSIEIVAGSLAEQMFELSASTGQLRFAGVPAEARVYVDDAVVVSSGGAALELSVGPHTLRVETASALLFSGSVDVVAGEQTIRIGGDRGP